MKKRILMLSLAGAMLVLTSCGGSSSSASGGASTAAASASTEKIIDIKTIAGKTEAEVEKVLGKPDKTEDVKGYPCKNVKGCHRLFFKGNKYEVIFKNSKADRITIYKVGDLSSNDKALETLGLPASEPSFKNDGIVRWNNVEGFHDIGFYSSDYILIQLSDPEI